MSTESDIKSTQEATPHDVVGTTSATAVQHPVHEKILLLAVAVLMLSISTFAFVYDNTGHSTPVPASAQADIVKRSDTIPSSVTFLGPQGGDGTVGFFLGRQSVYFVSKNVDSDSTSTVQELVAAGNTNNLHIYITIAGPRDFYLIGDIGFLPDNGILIPQTDGTLAHEPYPDNFPPTANNYASIFTKDEVKNCGLFKSSPDLYWIPQDSSVSAPETFIHHILSGQDEVSLQIVFGSCLYVSSGSEMYYLSNDNYGGPYIPKAVLVPDVDLASFRVLQEDYNNTFDAIAEDKNGIIFNAVRLPADPATFETIGRIGGPKDGIGVFFWKDGDVVGVNDTVLTHITPESVQIDGDHYRIFADNGTCYSFTTKDGFDMNDSLCSNFQ